MPKTSGCGVKRPENAEALQIKLIDADANLDPLFEATLNDIFAKFDLVISNTIDFKEFKGFLYTLGKTLASEISFKDEVLSKFNSTDAGLTLKGFKQWWKS